MKEHIGYLEEMTDDFGMIQFAQGERPDIATGYTIDDVARGLIVSSQRGLDHLTAVYTRFITQAQIPDGRFVNVYNQHRQPLEKVGSEDSFGRTIWALGEQLSLEEDMGEVSSKALQGLEEYGLHFPMSESFAILGLAKMYDAGFETGKTRSLLEGLTDSLQLRLREHRDATWSWTANDMSYENARVPQAFWRAYGVTGRNDYLDSFSATQQFLDDTVFETDAQNELFLNVVGNSTSGVGGTWYNKGSEKPKFDEQPVDAGGMVDLHADIYQITKDSYNAERADIAFGWFHKRNRLGLPLVSEKGGVFDGLNAGIQNRNKGAESLLAYMMADHSMQKITK